VKQADLEERGAFMLTTVRVSDASIASYLFALLDAHKDIYQKSAVFKNGESEQEYSKRQQYVMQSSQSEAVQAAYKKLGIPYRIQNDKVLVLRTLPEYPAAKELIAGDELVKINDVAIKKSTELNEFLKTKQPGNGVVLTYKRNNEEKIANLTLAKLPAEKDDKGNEIAPERAGLGFVPADMQSVQPELEDKQVTIKSGEIGGPSAGLMFTLEIMNQLSPGDLSKGYRIAGTGTISSDGKVGPIGGIEHKIIAAHKAGAEIFLAPADDTTTPASPRNYSDAAARAKEIGTAMRIIPVGTLEDALKAIDGLPPKSAPAKAS
jgi:PDZ domain-containing protein